MMSVWGFYELQCVTINIGTVRATGLTQCVEEQILSVFHCIPQRTPNRTTGPFH